MVQYADGVQPKFKFFRFRKPDTLDEIRIEAELCRALEPFQAHVADPSWRWIHEQQITLSVGYRFVAERTL